MLFRSVILLQTFRGVRLDGSRGEGTDAEVVEPESDAAGSTVPGQEGRA